MGFCAEWETGCKVACAIAVVCRTCQIARRDRALGELSKDAHAELDTGFAYASNSINQDVGGGGQRGVRGGAGSRSKLGWVTRHKAKNAKEHQNVTKLCVRVRDPHEGQTASDFR